MIDWPHTDSYVITHMYQFVASTTAPYLEADVRRQERMLMKYEFVWYWLYTYKFVCDNSHVSLRSINDGPLFGLLHQHHLPKVLTFSFGGWSEEVRWNTNLYDWLITHEFVCGNSHVSIRSINDSTLFGGRRKETHEDANKIRICMIDWPHTNLYVVTHMF